MSSNSPSKNILVLMILVVYKLVQLEKMNDRRSVRIDLEQVENQVKIIPVFSFKEINSLGDLLKSSKKCIVEATTAPGFLNQMWMCHT